ncbi:hypothetical protein [Bergeyella sp. RCAD1439]|uniref:hypothetical protein n=1 Tax=Bergeyella anatis TaxID=3113737 RepID=UPI002E173E31|nr:hypothetical protein [Bergeyella sp. RCAD1439]
MAGGKITRIVGSVSSIECDSWNVYTDEFNASSGGKSVFTADGGTHFGTPKEPPSAGKYFVKGWWTDENDQPIKEAHIGDTIRFHIETKGIDDGEKVDFIVYDWDYFKPFNDKLLLFEKDTGAEKNKIIIKQNRGYIEWTTGEGSLRLIDEMFEGDEIELFVECSYREETISLPYMESDYLVLKEEEEIITVLIELPHSGHTDKLNRKGLGGHTGIIIGDEYYDYGPQPGSPFMSDGRPWWDGFGSDNLTKDDIITILENEDLRKNGGIIGRVCLIDIHIRGSEKNKIEKWWKERYKDLRTYSVIPAIGEQCTTTVRISIESCTVVFNYYTSEIISFKKITNTTQSPQGFLELLLEEGVHTYGSKKGTKLTVTKDYAEIN